MGGQFIDAAVVKVRRPRLTREEKATLRDSRLPAG
jgi:transposase, IS5 family